MKKVTITLWADSEFVKALVANTTLSGLGAKARGDKIQPIDQLAFTAMMEFRGADEGQIMESISDAWRPNFGVVLDGRSVVEL